MEKPPCSYPCKFPLSPQLNPEPSYSRAGVCFSCLCRAPCMWVHHKYYSIITFKVHSRCEAYTLQKQQMTVEETQIISVQLSNYGPIENPLPMWIVRWNFHKIISPEEASSVCVCRFLFFPGLLLSLQTYFELGSRVGAQTASSWTALAFAVTGHFWCSGKPPNSM